MYLPPHFRESDVAALHATMRAFNFVTLVSTTRDGLAVSHVPVLVQAAPAPYGSLIGHFARPNAHWQAGADAPVLAIFTGPSGYISPNWYASKRAGGKVVPTWNYVAVHAHGTLRVIDDTAGVRSIVAALTAQHEAPYAQPWHIDDAPAEYMTSMLKGIVGFEIPIERIEGKYKLGQNRTAEDRASAVTGLREHGGNALALAMERAAPNTPG